jgi:hypothetical protein
VQFCVFEKGIYTFNPETGAKEHLADDIESWAQRILAEYADLTGFPLARAWQAANRPLKPRERLAANLPYFLGGEFELDNLTAADAVKLMSFLGCVVKQTRNLPDGTKIQIRFT